MPTEVKYSTAIFLVGDKINLLNTIIMMMMMMVMVMVMVMVMIKNV